MMFGGGMTLAPARSAGVLGIGVLMMLIFIGLPVLLVIAVVAGLIGSWGRRVGPMVSPPARPTSAPTITPGRYCAQCGQGLQADWAHCPKCGSPVTG